MNVITYTDSRCYFQNNALQIKDKFLFGYKNPVDKHAKFSNNFWARGLEQLLLIELRHFFADSLFHVVQSELRDGADCFWLLILIFSKSLCVQLHVRAAPLKSVH